MKAQGMQGLKRAVILSDGIRGHFHQSLGVARWLERLHGVKIEPEIRVPELAGIRRLLMLKILAGKLADCGPDYASEWLKKSGFSVPDISEVMNAGPGTLFISTGSKAAPFCLALAKATGNRSAVIMTPSVLGTEPFDFAIVPEHDKHKADAKNMLTTLGAPNHIYVPDLKKAAEEKFSCLDFLFTRDRKVLALLLGGSDVNYSITPEWAKKALAPLKDLRDVTLLITTSRRTGKSVDDVIEHIFKDSPNLGYMLLASRNPEENPVPAMLGTATHVLVTEDSVSMASEAATAGFRVGLIRVGRTTGFFKNLFGWGAVRFDEMFEKMKVRNLIEDLGKSPDFRKFVDTPAERTGQNEQKHRTKFNEAQRAAEWILSSFES